MRALVFVGAVGLFGCAMLAQLSCAEVLGLQDRPVDNGAGGIGGAGTLCEPGAVEQCKYSGPTGTNGVGACKAAKRTCNDQGTEWSACEGEVTPDVEVCNTAADDDCDGEANEADAGCACIPDITDVCYSGPTGTADVGFCKNGERTCNEDGLGYGSCIGEVLPTIEDCTKKGDEDCSGMPCSDTLWSSIHGDEAGQYVQDVAIDVQGNIILIGSFNGSIAFGDTTLISAKSDIYVAKFDPVGNALWAKRFGNSDYQSPKGLAVDKDGNILIAGTFEKQIDFGGGLLLDDGGSGFDAFVAKLDPNGGHLWSKPILASGYALMYDISVDPSGDVLLAGQTNATVDFGGASVTSVTGPDAYVAKLSGESGVASWAQRFGASGSQLAVQVKADVSGNIVVVGGFSGSISLGFKNYAAPPGEDRLFIARLDPSGEPFFSMEVIGSPVFPSLAVDSSGNLLLATVFSDLLDFGDGPLVAVGPFDIALVKISAGGTITMVKQFGGPSLMNLGEPDEFFVSVGTDAMGNIALVTSAKGTIDFGGGFLGGDEVPNIFAGKIDSNGNHVWSKQFGPVDFGLCFMDTAGNGAMAIACLVVARSLDLGTGPLVGAGGGDIVVAKRVRLHTRASGN